MRVRSVATLAVALFFGLIATILVRNYVAHTGTANLQSSGTTPVVISSQEIGRGVALKASMLKVVNYPRESVPAGGFQDVSQLMPSGQAPRITLASLAANEPILSAKLSGPGGRPNLSGVIEAGMRAVSLRSNDVAGVGGFVLPGDRVDVLLTRSDGTQQTTSVTQVLAQNALVLGVDQSDNQEASKPVVTKSVTVQVTPEQAATISLGESIGSLSLALRRDNDDAPLVSRATTVADLRAVIPHSPVAAVPVRREPRASARPSAEVTSQPQALVRVVRGVDAMFYSGTDDSLTPVVAGRAVAPSALSPAVGRP